MAEGAGCFHVHCPLSNPSSRRTPGPIRRGGIGSTVAQLPLVVDSAVAQTAGRWLWVPAFAGTTMESGIPSRHRKSNGLAAARHVDGRKADRGKAAAAAIALFGDFELALARAQLFRAAPVQRLVLEPDGAVLGIDGLGETEDLLRLAGHVRVQAFAGIDAVPAAAGHGLAVVGGNRRHDLVRGVVAPGQPGGRRLLHRFDHGGEEILRLHDVGR